MFVCKENLIFLGKFDFLGKILNAQNFPWGNIQFLHVIKFLKRIILEIQIILQAADMISDY